jgi:hypothetical protein
LAGSGHYRLICEKEIEEIGLDDSKEINYFSLWEVALTYIPSLVEGLFGHFPYTRLYLYHNQLSENVPFLCTERDRDN